jgi:hypothetical protein
MEITGKIIAVLEPRKGTSSRTGSEWICGQYVLETMDQYPRKLFCEGFGADRMQQFNIQLGEVMTVSFDIDAREYQGRWFNSIRAWKVDRNLQPQTPPVLPPDVAPIDVPPVSDAPDDLTAGAPFSSGVDDLPF